MSALDNTANALRVARYILFIAAAVLIVSVVGRVYELMGVPPMNPAFGLIAPPGPHSPQRQVDVMLWAQDAPDLSAFRFVLVYDPALVQGNPTLSTTSLMTGGIQCDEIRNRCVVEIEPQPLHAGETLLGAYTYGSGPGPNVNGIIAVIHLQPTGKLGTTPLRLTQLIVANTKGSQYLPSVVNASLTFDNPPPPTPFPRAGD